MAWTHSTHRTSRRRLRRAHGEMVSDAVVFFPWLFSLFSSLRVRTSIRWDSKKMDALILV